MNLIAALILLVSFETYLCEDMKELFENVNKKTEYFNGVAAEIAWESSVHPDDPKLSYKAAKYQKERITWQQQTCNELASLEKRHLFNSTQSRQTYLLCRGPKYTFPEARFTSKLYEELQTIYNNAEVCILTDENVSLQNFTQLETSILKYLKTVSYFLKMKQAKDNPISFAAKIAANEVIQGNNVLCLKEEEFEKLMEYSRNEEVLKWLWLAWREKVSPPMKTPFRKLVDVENVAARRNGYTDIGASWRDEQEVYQLRQVCRRLFNRILPLYTLLHGVVRFYLRKKYGNVVPERGPIPAHLLGNLWSQNWEPLADLILPKAVNLDESIHKLNWTVEHMAKRAEDFYMSLGLVSMTDTFWKKSVFSRNDKETRCHGTAADMFRKDDFRLLYCSGTTVEDFYVLHHEFGHIQYYMAYEHQQALFRQANTALHEAIGDAIMYGVTTPQHLHRLGLINDTLLYDTNDNEKLDEININKGNFDTNDNDKIDKFNKDNFDTKDNGKLTVIDKFNKQDFHTNDNDKLGKFNNDNFDANDNDKLNKIKKLNKHDFGINDNRKLDKFNKDNFDTNVNEKLDKTNKFNKDEHFSYIIKYKTKIPQEIDAEKLNHKTEDIESNLHITTNDILMLKQALNKIPQIPFALLIDEFRWRYFEDEFTSLDMNNKFWQMALEFQGIAPPMERGMEYFDVGAKFHVPDNTPYIRYFLSSFLQHQLFETLCKAAVFGRRNTKYPLPDTITLDRCDIYGSKSAGKVLKDIMSRGHSQHWRQILIETIGQDDISSAPLERYYRPLYILLMKLVKLNRIPIGW